MSNEFYLDLIASLQQAKSKKQVNAEIRQLEKVINMLRLTATLAKGNTKNEINSYIKELGGKLDYIKLKGKIDDKNLKREIDKILHNMTFKEIDALNIDGNKAKLKMKKVIADIKSYAEKTPISVNVSLKKEKLSNDLTTFLNKNSKIRESSVLLAESERIRELIDSVDDKGTLRNATDAFSLFRAEVNATGFAGKSTSQKIKDMLGNITKIGSFFGVASLAVNNFRKSLSTLRTNDTILTEISKTSEMTKQQLKELGDDAFKVASKYGQLSGNYLLGVQEMARSGYESLSKELAELSLLAQSAGDMTAENANNYILATDAAYKYGGSVEKLNAALDGANYISNKNSASLTDIADATRVSASFAANAGIAIDELTAAEATMIATTKRSGSEMGRSFRSIILNLQQVSGEFDGEIIDEEQLKKVEARCHSLGVELEYMKDGVPTLRNTMEVLKDLAEVYNSLPDNSAEKQGLISDLGGKYHANALSALLSRWDLYEKMLSEFSQGAGSALEEANKTADSWEGRIAKLQNSWDSFINTLTNKDAIKGGISFFDRLIQGATELTNAVGEIPVVLTALNSALVAHNKDYGITQIWNKDKGKIDLQGNIFGIDFTETKNMKKHFAEAEGAIAKWNAVLVTGNANINKFGEAIVQNNTQFKEYLSTCSKDAPASLEGYKSYLKSTGANTDALRVKTLLLNSAITMLGGIILQIAFQAIVKGIDNLAHSAEHCKERVDELMSSYQSAIDKANSNAKTIEELASRYEELSQGVDRLGRNVSLSKDKYTEYNKIVNQIADMFPTMIQGYTNEGNAILSLKGNVEQLRDAYKEAQQEAYNLLIASGKDSSGNDIIKNYNNQVNSKYNFAGIRDESGSKDIIKILTTLTGALTPEEFREAWSQLHKEYESIWDTDKKINNALNLSGFSSLMSFDNYATMTSDDLAKAKQSARAIIQTYQAEIDSALKGVKLLANAYLMTNEDYENLSDQCKNAASVMVNSLSSEMADGFENPIDVGSYVDGIVAAIKDNSDVQEAVTNLFSIDISNTPINEAKSRIDEYTKIIADAIGEDQFELKVRLGFEDIDDINTRLQNSIRKLTEDHGIIDLDAYSYLINEVDFKNFTKEQAEVWLNATQGAKSATDAVAKYNEALSSTIEDGGIKTFSQAWSDLFTSEEESVKKLGETLLGLAEKGQLTVEAFNEADSTGYFKNLGISADEAVNKINQLVDKSSQLSSMSSQISKISGALGSKRDDGFVSADTLSGFDAEIRGLDSWDHFQEVLGNVNSSYQKCQEAANALASELVSSNDFLAQLTEQNKEYYATQLKAMGVDNYEEILTYAYQLNTAKEALSLASFDLATATAQEIQELIKEGTYSELAQQQIWNLVLAKQTEEETNLETSGDCQRLLNLAKNAGVTGQSIELLTELMRIYNNLENGVYGTNKDVLDEVKTRAEAIKQNIMNLLSDNANETAVLKPKLKLSPSTKAAAKKAGKETGKSYLDGLKEELSKMSSIISYVSKLLGKKITSYGKQKDDAVKGLEAQKDAAKEALEAQKNAAGEAAEAQKDAAQAQIDAKQAEIDKIKEAAEARKNEISLQKAQYDLARMQNQRATLIYSEDKGMHYVADTKGIRDAKDSVTDAKENIRISSIEKEISALEKTIDAINKQTEALEEQASATSDYYDTLMDESDAYYDQLIEDTEAYWDSLIKGLEDYQTRWEELADIEEEAKMNAALKELGITTEEILNMSEEDFEIFKQKYLAILTEIYAGNEDVLSALQEASGISVESLQPLIDELQKTIEKTDEYSDSADNAKIETDNWSIEIDELASSADGASESIGNLNTELGNVPSTEGFDAVADVLDRIRGVADAVCESVKKAAGELNYFQGVKDALEAGANVAVDIANKTQTGKAYASGTGISGLDHDEKNALRSEYGQTELTAYPDGTTELTTSPVMSDLPKGTVVYNEEQTKKIMDNKPIPVGNAHADGTDDSIWTTLADGTKVRPLQPGDRMYDLVQKFDSYFKSMDGNLEKLVPNSFYEHQRQMEDMAKQINYVSNIVNNNRNMQPVTVNQNVTFNCPNLTNNSGIEYIQRELGHLSQMAEQEPLRDY